MSVLLLKLVFFVVPFTMNRRCVHDSLANPANLTVQWIRTMPDKHIRRGETAANSNEWFLKFHVC